MFNIPLIRKYTRTPKPKVYFLICAFVIKKHFMYKQNSLN